ncbi:hypothetical protein R3I93_015445 [Phoxinus phoxinus]|uniref:Uncharacterized protein n=1 Tax=Phoxinus phoxinus TaxID=58324 RepID=A0AAN9CRB4_9TELE
MKKAYNFVLIKEGNSTTTLPQAQPEPQHQAQPEPQHQAQPEPQHQAQPEPQHQAQPEPQHQAQPEPQHQAQPEPQHQAQPEPQHQAQEKETFYILDLYPVSLPVKEQPPSKKRKRCRKCSSQKVFKYDSLTGRRINEGQAEVRVKWLPCSACGKIWEETWEPACQFLPGANHV